MIIIIIVNKLFIVNGFIIMIEYSHIFFIMIITVVKVLRKFRYFMSMFPQLVTISTAITIKASLIHFILLIVVIGYYMILLLLHLSNDYYIFLLISN